MHKKTIKESTENMESYPMCLKEIKPADNSCRVSADVLSLVSQSAAQHF